MTLQPSSIHAVVCTRAVAAPAAAAPPAARPSMSGVAGAGAPVSSVSPLRRAAALIVATAVVAWERGRFSLFSVRASGRLARLSPLLTALLPGRPG